MRRIRSGGERGGGRKRKKKGKFKRRKERLNRGRKRKKKRKRRGGGGVADCRSWRRPLRATAPSPPPSPKLCIWHRLKFLETQWLASCEITKSLEEY